MLIDGEGTPETKKGTHVTRTRKHAWTSCRQGEKSKGRHNTEKGRWPAHRATSIGQKKKNGNIAEEPATS